MRKSASASEILYYYKPLLQSNKIKEIPRVSNYRIYKKYIILSILSFLIFLIFHTNLHQTKFQEHAVNLHKKVMKYFKSSNKIILPQSGIELEDGLSEDAKKLMKQLNLTNPGVNGTALNLDTNLLTEEQKIIEKQGWDEYGCNVFVSDLISLNRVVQDNRSDYCKQKVYSQDLPKASVVLIFYNEAWSILLRTVHSILINTPEHLLEEIVLVDDFSDKKHLKEPLEDICKKLKKCKLIRSHKRLPISAVRVLGFRNAKGPIIVSLDSHVEVSPGWLEPMLDRLKDNPTLATYGVTNPFTIDNFKLYYLNDRYLFGFAFYQLFFYHIKIETYQPELNYWEPHRSPILYGPNFAFWKEFGEKIGFIDTEFDIWGGDDLEFSLRVWLCGGSIEHVPCTSIFHMLKKHNYNETSGKGGSYYNNNRIVETWFDDYKKYYYRTNTDAIGKPFGDISENLKLKEKISCKNFKWYVENVFPNLWISDDIKDENWSSETTTKKSIESDE